MDGNLQKVLVSLEWLKVSIKGLFKKLINPVLIGPVLSLFVIVGAFILIAIGVKNVHIGGLLARLFGKKDPEDNAIDVANTVPEDRIGKDGKLIPQGKPDSEGMTQAIVVPIENPGLFSNPNIVKFTPPGEKAPVEIKLPVGVQAKDVDKVVVVKPKQFVVTVKDSSGIKGKKIDDLLTKYGG